MILIIDQNFSCHVFVERVIKNDFNNWIVILLKPIKFLNGHTHLYMHLPCKAKLVGPHIF